MEKISASMFLPSDATVGTDNVQGVGISGEKVMVLGPLQLMTKHQALVHAAWLVAVAEEHPGDFAAILDRVRV